MQACECVFSLKLSLIPHIFEPVCQFLDQQGWDVLCMGLSRLELLGSSDLDAITFASKFTKISQSKELLLRLEAKSEYNFVISQLLHYLQIFGLFHQCDFLLSSLGTLHRPDCHRLQRLNHCNGNIHHLTRSNINRNADTLPETPASTLAMNSLNNLSNPDRPYLQILTHPNDTSLKVGEYLILKCFAEGQQALISYTWYKDNVRIDYNDKLLIIEDVQVSDSGDYRCEVQHEGCPARESSKIAKVSVTAEQSSDDIQCDMAFASTAEGHGCISDTTDSVDSDPNSVYFATDKFALLIANENYTHNPRLTSASNDVKALASTLKEKLQFKTISMVNLNLEEMERAVDLFCSHLTSGAYCLTYLAGHGFENDGQCYIVPTDAPKGYISSGCFSVKKMIKKIHDTCPLNLTVVLLDVCRKRNENVASFVEPTDVKGKLGNLVISFATMESGMAYEVKGQHLGVYVSSLQRHLGKDKRVTRVLELVHRDVHKDLHAKGIQQPEFKSNMFEDRKLTDPIAKAVSSIGQQLKDWDWRNTHECMLPVAFFFESCAVRVTLELKNEFSNTIVIKADIADGGVTEKSRISLFAKMKKPHHELGFGVAEMPPCSWPVSSSFRVENLQRLAKQVLPVTIQVQYLLDGSIFEEVHNELISIPFLLWWKDAL